MKKLEQLLKDKDINHYYELADNKYYHVEHNINHALRVMKTCRRLASKLNLAPMDTENICIAAFLHDTGANNIGKDGHAERSYEIAKRYTDNEKILNAIRYHSAGDNSDYGYILTLADKLDICGQRVTDWGKTLIGVRQFVHLTSMNFDIVNNSLIIKFTTDGKLDLQELNAYYFIKKIFNAIKNFANYFKLTYKVYLDDDEWIN